MRTVIQRVKNAAVTIEGKVYSQIHDGLLVLLGIEDEDNREDIEWLCKKIINMRIFDDAQGVMNLSLLDKHYDALIVSQFTLHASTKKGNRPSYIKAARPDVAIPLYEKFIEEFSNQLGKSVKTGEFGADMQIDLCNDGPVTIVIDTKQKE
jgi:D-tyrosyl-tRNA(Tyr) deacylase